MKLLKYSTIFILTAALTAGFCSCNSTKVDASTEADSYSAGTEVENDTAVSLEKKPKKENSFSIKNIFGADKFEEIDTCEVNTTTVTYSLKKQQGSIVLNKKANTVGFGSPYMAAYYFLSMDKANCEKLAKAVDQYYSDFENKKLKRDDKNSYKAYGTTQVRLDWGSVKSSTPNHGEGPAYFGYKFKDKSPYFTISTFEIGNDKIYEEDTPIKTSMQLSYYFTKSQIKHIVDIINSDKVEDAFLEDPEVEVLESDEY